MTQLNSVGEALGSQPGVHAMTDVTGFGLCGHLLEVCRGSGLAAEVDIDKVGGWHWQAEGGLVREGKYINTACVFWGELAACKRAG
jgi:selenophosphate synthase